MRRRQLYLMATQPKIEVKQVEIVSTMLPVKVIEPQKKQRGRPKKSVN